LTAYFELAGYLLIAEVLGVPAETIAPERKIVHWPEFRRAVTSPPWVAPAVLIGDIGAFFRPLR
jgi:hypothetical protein